VVEDVLNGNLGQVDGKWSRKGIDRIREASIYGKFKDNPTHFELFVQDFVAR
jgi:hypothetical protein